MTQAEQEIADLHASLVADGEIITLKRGAATVDCAAFVRNLSRNRPNQLVDAVAQQELLIVISPVEINAVGWPSGPDSPPAAVDPRIPIKGDKMTVAGRLRTVQETLPILVGNVLVRMEINVKG